MSNPNLNVLKSNVALAMGLKDYNEIGVPRFIWKYGIALLCDVHDDIEYLLTTDDIDSIHSVSNFDRIKDGDLIWLEGGQLDDFIKYILPQIKSHFTLVTATSSDITFTARLTTSNLDKLFESGFLLHWFTENFDDFIFMSSNDQNKLLQKYKDMFSPLPIGLDFHSSFIHLQHGHMKHGHFDYPMAQNRVINKLLNDESKVPLISDRKLKIYVDFTLNAAQINDEGYKENLRRYYERKKDFEAFIPWSESDQVNGGYSFRRNPERAFLFSQLMANQEKDEIFYISDRMRNQYSLFVERSKYVFLLSPLGNGFDCHRTWEGILFGHIVIVKTSPLDRLYKEHNLPVVIVNDWMDINQTMLSIWYEEYRNLTYFENVMTRYKMTTDYWIAYMRNITMHKLLHD